MEIGYNRCTGQYFLGKKNEQGEVLPKSGETYYSSFYEATAALDLITPETPKWCVKLAQALQDKWQIGETSIFCDEIEFDRADENEIAKFIWETYQEIAK